MARKRAAVSPENVQRALGTDILDRILDAEGLTEAPVIEVPTDQVDPNPYQTRQNFNEESLDELVISIRAHGFYGHLVARQVGNRYQIAYGERRLRAAQRAGLSQLPLAVRDLSDEQMMELSVTENVLREDLNPIEEAEAYQHLANMNYSLRQISKRVGKSPGHISMLLSLLKQEDVTEAVRQEKVGIREAHQIAKVEDEATRQNLLARTAQGELDREAVRQAVRMSRKQVATPPPAAISPAETPDLKTVSEENEIVEQPSLEFESSASIDVAQRLADIYDPQPNLRAALTRLEKIRPDRFTNIEENSRADVQALLNEIIARGQYFLEQLDQKSDS